MIVADLEFDSESAIAFYMLMETCPFIVNTRLKPFEKVWNSLHRIHQL